MRVGLNRESDLDCRGNCVRVRCSPAYSRRCVEYPRTYIAETTVGEMLFRLHSSLAAGGHVLTTAQWNKTSPGLFTFVYDRLLKGGSDRFSLGASWPGDSNSSNLGWGQWSWIDGTNASNLNCNRQGCGVWGRYANVAWQVCELSRAGWARHSAIGAVVFLFVPSHQPDNFLGGEQSLITLLSEAYSLNDYDGVHLSRNYLCEIDLVTCTSAPGGWPWVFDARSWRS